MTASPTSWLIQFMCIMLKHTELILPENNYENCVTAIAWSPDDTILAAALNDDTIYIFHHGVMKHVIQVECSISIVSKSKHSIKDIAFSPDSTKLAVAHVHGAICVYKIHINDCTSNATICNEFLQNSSVTCLICSTNGPIVFGLKNGKVRACQIETEMTWTLYSTDSPTIRVTANDTGTSILSSHMDGSIFHFNLTSDRSINTANRILTYLTIPQDLAWAQDNILVGDRDGHVVFYDNDGKILQTFDYSEENSAEYFKFVCCSSTKTSIAINLCGKVHLYNWNKESKFWEEIDSSIMDVVGTVTALALKKDGSKLAVGGLHGAVAEFKSVNDANKDVGILIRNVDSNLVSEISLENDNGLSGSTIWPMMQNCNNNSSLEAGKYLEKSFDEKLKLRKPTNIEKQEKLVKTKDKNDSNSSSLIITEAKNKNEIVSSFSTWNESNKAKVKVTPDWKKTKSKNEIDYISSDIASTCNKSSFTIDFDSTIILSSEDELDLTMNDSAIASRTVRKKKSKIHRVESIPTPSVANGMLLENLNDIPYDPTIDPPCWKGEMHRSDKTRFSCRNCGRLDVSMKYCPRCKDAYHNWNREIYNENYSQKNLFSPIRFTKQYTPEELRADFTLQLALLASLSPGLQRILEQQMLSSKKDQCC